MKNYFKEIKQKLESNIKLEKVEIVDNSLKHRNHKFFDSEKYHLKLKIKSLYLNSISKINAHKIIMKVKLIFSSSFFLSCLRKGKRL